MATEILDVLARGALLTALFGAAAWLLRHRTSAGTRASLWVALFSGLLALPALHLLLPALPVPVLPGTTAATTAPAGAPDESASRGYDSATAAESAVGPERSWNALADIGPAPAAGAPTTATPGTADAVSSGRIENRTNYSPPAGRGLAAPQPGLIDRARQSLAGTSPWALVAALWAAGCALLLTRLLAGVLVAASVQNRTSTLLDRDTRQQFRRLCKRAGLASAPELLESAREQVPLAIQLRHEAIVVPAGFHRWPEQRREAVLLHELAHLQRRDCWLQLLARVAVAVHWLNPLAWLAAHRLWLERERACDDFVVQAGMRPSDYASHLLALASDEPPDPRLAAAAFARRRHLPDRVRSILRPHGHRSPARRTPLMVTTLALAIVLPVAAAIPVAASSPAPSAPEPTAVAEASRPTTMPTEATAATSAGAAQQALPSIDDLVRMRIHGVSPEFIEAITQVAGDVDVDTLVQLRIHGVTPDFARQMRDATGEDLDLDDLVQSRIHGVTPEFTAAIRSELGESLTFSQLRQMRIHGVSPELVAAARDQLGEEVSASQIVQMRIHGVSEEFIRDMQQLLPHEEISANDLVQMRIHGVSTDLVRELRDDGYDDLTVDELVKIRIHGMDRILRRRSGGQR